MVDQNFTLKEILYTVRDEIKDDIKDLKSANKGDHDRMEKQTQSSIDRIVFLEKEIVKKADIKDLDKIKDWRAKLSGAWLVLNVMLTLIALPLVLVFLKTMLFPDSVIYTPRDCVSEQGSMAIEGKDKNL